VASTASSGTAAQAGSWLVFRVGPHVLSASALEVEGIIQRPERINKLPSMAHYALGVFMFREQWPLAISLRRKLEVQDEGERTEGVFIIARVRNGLIAFGVDEVKEVIDGSELAWQPMPEMPSADLFDRYAIRNGEIVLHAGFEKLLEANIGIQAVAEWKASHSPAAATDAREPDGGSTPAQEEQRIVAAPIAATTTEPQPVMPQPAAQSPERARKTFRRVDTTRRPAPAQPMAPRLPRPPELRLVPPQAVQLEAPAIDDAPAPPAPPVQARTRKGTASPAYWFGAAALASAVLTGAWFAYTPAPAPADASVSRPVTTGAIRQEQPMVAAPPPAAPAAPVISAIKSETFTVTIERPAKAGSAPQVQPASAGNTRVHVVARGDTLSAIARKYLGDGLRYRELAQLSRIDNPHRIYPGDIVRIEVRERR